MRKGRYPWRMNPTFVYLASASPRRRELLSQIGVPFQILMVEVDESVAAAESPAAYVSRLAAAKADAGRHLRQQAEHRAPYPVLAADTTVVIDGEILGKPADDSDAARMLRLLSGRTHEVLTAVALAAADRRASSLSRSEVTFRQSGRRRHGIIGIPGSRATRRADMPFKGAVPSSLPTCAAVIPASWVCRCTKPRSFSSRPACRSGAPQALADR